MNWLAKLECLDQLKLKSMVSIVLKPFSIVLVITIKMQLLFYHTGITMVFIKSHNSTFDQNSCTCNHISTNLNFYIERAHRETCIIFNYHPNNAVTYFFLLRLLISLMTVKVVFW